MADPDLAQAALTDLASGFDLTGFDAGDPAWRRLIAVLGGSRALGRWLRLRPAEAGALLAEPTAPTKAELVADIWRRVGPESGLSPDQAVDELRWAYRHHLGRLAAADLTAAQPTVGLTATMTGLTDLADAVVESAYRLAVAQVPQADRVRLAVVALGKAGAGELNYVSDVDVLYVAEPGVGVDGRPALSAGEAVGLANQVAGRLQRVCSAYTAAGTIWQVDANLRPEGAAGPLTRTLAAMGTYYEKWADNWEYQALLKARPMAGDLELGQRFCDMVAPLVWTAADRDGFVTQAQAMRARVVARIPPADQGRDIKLGAGGLRDTEFSVQLLQLVHGRADDRLRLAGTLPGLAVLTDHGYIGRADGAELDQAYRFQRLLEHRLQLYDLRRTHMMPTEPEALRRVARGVGLGEAAAVQAAWRASAVTVQRLHQRIFYSPLLEAVAHISGAEVRLTPAAAATRLRALGYADPEAALRHIEALIAGVSRRSEMLRQLLPALLGWMADGPNPDMGLLAFRQVAEALGSTPWFLRSLRDEGQMAQELAVIVSSSRYAGGLLQRLPSSVELLRGGGTTDLPTAAVLSGEMAGVVARYGPGDHAGDIIRSIRRRELLRIAMAHILDRIDIQTVGRALSALTDATIDALLRVAGAGSPSAPALALIALGRWGGAEMSYSSDADALVVVEDTDDPAALKQVAGIMSRLQALLKVPGPELELKIDTRLRPEGRDGPPARTLASYQSYYAKWSLPWERQALLRARFGAGDAEVGRRFLGLIDPLRYSPTGLAGDDLREIRRIKARMESERLGRGVDAKSQVKLGPGGLSDVEWTVQVIQLRHAHGRADLRTTATLAGLDAAATPVNPADPAGALISPDDAAALRTAFLLAWRIRDANTLLRGRPSDLLPANAADLSQLAMTMGYPRSGGSHLDQAWRRASRRAKDVVDRLFWGETP